MEFSRCKEKLFFNVIVLTDCGPTRSTERPDPAALPRTSTTEMESENGVPQSGRNPSWSPSETGEDV